MVIAEITNCVVWMVSWWLIGDVIWGERYSLVYGWMMLRGMVWDTHVVVLEISQFM